MTEELRDVYRALESRYVHEGRTIDPSFYRDLSDDSVAKFSNIGFDCLLSLDEKFCPRFIYEFYKTLQLDRDPSNHLLIQFVINNHRFNISRAQFAELTSLPNQGIYIYSDAWVLDELDKTLEQIPPYNSCLPAIDDIRNFIHRRTTHEKIKKEGKPIHKLPNQIETNELFDHLRPCELVIRENIYSAIGNRDHTQAIIALMLYYLENGQPFNLAYFIIRKMYFYRDRQDKVIPYRMILTRLFKNLKANMKKHPFDERYKLVPRKMSSPKSPPSDNGDFSSTKLSPRSYSRALPPDPNMSKEQKEARGMVVHCASGLSFLTAVCLIRQRFLKIISHRDLRTKPLPISFLGSGLVFLLHSSLPLSSSSDLAVQLRSGLPFVAGKENGVNISKSINEVPFQMGTFQETLAEGNEGALHLGPEQARLYSNLSPMLLEGSELTKEDRESQLYDDFEHFYQNKGETIHDYYESNYDQLYAYLKQHEAHANENNMMLERFTQHTVDPLALMSNVSPQQYSSQSSTTPPSTHALPGNNPRGAGAVGNGGAQNRVGNANPAQENGVVLDKEQLLFLVGGHDTTVDEADGCDAFDSDVDEAPTAHTMFMANLSSADLVYDKVSPSYDSNILSEVHEYDSYLDAICEHHEAHEMHHDV
ncbi:hypothetical protein Tco_0974362 [Tanacetum coccineum]|uniref:Uncharacterized protein n=1 Tax=Tanacetum coccineum TaxID=301880 RepID=A0ABQ5EBC6_9ASTR